MEISNNCECNIHGGGYCQRHGVTKSKRLVELCNTKIRYWQAWEAGRGPRQGQWPPFVQPPPVVGGPGTELKAIIAWWQKRFPWFDLSPRKGCGCWATAKRMDQLGPDGCEKNMDKILDKLEFEARQRNLSIPFQRYFAKKLVRQAIRRSRNKERVNAH